MRNLRVYMKALEESGHLKAVKGETDSNLEAAALTAQSYQEVGPALHFQNIKGYPRELTLAGGLFTGPGNLFLEKFKYWSRVCIALGVDPMMTYDKFQSVLLERISHPIYPVQLSTGPVKQVIQKGADADLSALPFPKLHEKDGGRYGTLQTMIVQDLESDWVVWENVRTMVLDKNRLAGYIPPHSRLAEIFAKYKAANKPMPFCLSIGGPPMVTLTSFLPLGKGVSPAGVAGGLTLDPIELMKAETNSLFIPTEAEVVIEGEVNPRETAPEGPYPAFWFYGGAQPAPVFHVKAISRRKDPIIPFSVDGVKPSDTHNLMSLMTSFELYNRLINIRNFPVKWVQMPLEFNLNFVIVCSKIIFPGYVPWTCKYVLSQARHFGALYNKVVMVDDKTTSLHLEEPILFMIQRTHPNKGYHFWDQMPIGPNVRFVSAEQKKKGYVSGMYIDTSWPMDWTRDDIPRRCNLEGAYPEEMVRKVAANYNKFGFKGTPVIFEEEFVPF